MKYIVALGNPGPEYEETRHNVGWLLADAFTKNFGFSEPIFNAKYQARISSGNVKLEEVLVLYPDTFMNHSGVVVKKLALKNPADELIVIHDEIDLPLGEVKLSSGKGDGGHNGIRSIIEHLGRKDFTRVRVGISPKSFFTGKMKRPSGEKLPKYVLGKFTKREHGVVEEVGNKTNEILETLILKGAAVAMNRYN